MSNEPKKPGALKKGFKLFLLIVVALLVPIVMDQAEVDPEKVRLVGRVAAGLTILLFLYGIFTKVMKIMGFLALVLIVLVVLVVEGKVKAPRVKEWFTTRDAGGGGGK